MSQLNVERELGSQVAPDDTVVVIVSPHGLLRHSLRTLLEPDFTRILSYSDVEQLKACCKDKGRGAVLLVEPVSGTPLSSQLRLYREFAVNWRMVLILRDLSEVDLGSAIGSGASGCITQQTPPEMIATLLSVVAAGHIVWPGTPADVRLPARRASDSTTHQPRRRPFDFDQKLALLSAREKEVLTFVGHGLGNKRIATAMGISDTTVRLHMRSIMRKLGAENRTQLVIHTLHAEMEAH